jgi:hypothetical protein
VSYQHLSLSGATNGERGRWASGASFDGQGDIEYVAAPEPLTDDEGQLGAGEPRLHGTSPTPLRVV